MRCIWINHQNIGVAGHWPIISGIEEERFTHLRAVSMTEIRNMYEVYHEMDLAHFVERLDELWNQHYPETNLKRIRDLAGLSQRELAELSGVSVRQIQLFEQRQRDINQTRAIDVLRLSRALGCKNEDLLEL